MKLLILSSITIGLLLINLGYVNAKQIEIVLDVYNIKFNTHRSILIGDAYTFESSNVLRVFVTEHTFDRIKEIYGTAEFPFTYQKHEYMASYKVWNVTLSANVPAGNKLTIKFVSYH